MHHSCVRPSCLNVRGHVLKAALVVQGAHRCSRSKRRRRGWTRCAIGLVSLQAPAAVQGRAPAASTSCAPIIIPNVVPTAQCELNQLIRYSTFALFFFRFRNLNSCIRSSSKHTNSWGVFRYFSCHKVRGIVPLSLFHVQSKQ